MVFRAAVSGLPPARVRVTRRLDGFDRAGVMVITDRATTAFTTVTF